MRLGLSIYKCNTYYVYFCMPETKNKQPVYLMLSIIITALNHQRDQKGRQCVTGHKINSILWKKEASSATKGRELQSEVCNFSNFLS